MIHDPALRALNQIADSLMLLVEDILLREHGVSVPDKLVSERQATERFHIIQDLKGLEKWINSHQSSYGIPYSWEDQRFEGDINFTNLRFCFDWLKHYIENLLPSHETYTLVRYKKSGTLNKDNQLQALTIFFLAIRSFSAERKLHNQRSERKMAVASK